MQLFGTPRLKPGDTVGIVNPAEVLLTRMVVSEIERKLDEIGLNMHVGRHVYDRYGYLGGTDENRAADIMRMFENPRIDAVMAVRGGWGCARILPLLDYERTRANPKIITGYSDITSLLIAI